MQIVSIIFCHIGTKRASCGLKIRQNPFSAESLPRTPLGELTTLPRPPSQLQNGHPFPYPTSRGTNPPSALAMRPPRIPARSTPMGVQVKLWDTLRTRAIPERLHDKALYKSKFTRPDLTSTRPTPSNVCLRSSDTGGCGPPRVTPSSEEGDTQLKLINLIWKAERVKVVTTRR